MKYSIITLRDQLPTLFHIFDRVELEQSNNCYDRLHCGILSQTEIKK